jgi:cytochrome c553
MIGVDWSEIRNYKNNFMLENYDDEDMQKLENFYDKL